MNTHNDNSKDKILVEIDSDLQGLIPGYLLNKQKEISSIIAALPASDFETIRIIGHNMKGNGSAYGFEMITEIAQRIELAAINGIGSDISEFVADLQSYFRNIEIVYVEV